MTKAMTKEEILRQLAKDNKITQKQAETFLNSLTSLITEQTNSTGLFVLPNVGRFKKHHRAGRKGINPQTGLPVYIQDKQVVKFVPAKQLSDTILQSK